MESLLYHESTDQTVCKINHSTVNATRGSNVIRVRKTSKRQAHYLRWSGTVSLRFSDHSKLSASAQPKQISIRSARGGMDAGV